MKRNRKPIGEDMSVRYNKSIIEQVGDFGLSASPPAFQDKFVLAQVQNITRCGVESVDGRRPYLCCAEYNDQRTG
jgi:hypothetical protein